MSAFFKQRVQGAFQYLHVGRPHFLYDITRVSFSPANDREDAEFKDALPHLTLCIFNIHNVFFIRFWNKDSVIFGTMQNKVPYNL
jgi:hypothetical protein